MQRMKTLFDKYKCSEFRKSDDISYDYKGRKCMVGYQNGRHNYFLKQYK